MMFYVKIHKATGEVMVAGCDRDVLGRVFSDGELELEVSEKFYGGELVNGEQLIRHMKDATIVNIIGDSIVDLAISEGLIDESRVRTVCGIKHAQIITID